MHVAATLKLVPVGDSLGVVLPLELLARWNVAEGDVLYLVESPTQGFTLVPSDPAGEQQIASARVVVEKRHQALGELVK